MSHNSRLLRRRYEASKDATVTGRLNFTLLKALVRRSFRDDLKERKDDLLRNAVISGRSVKKAERKLLLTKYELPRDLENFADTRIDRFDLPALIGKIQVLISPLIKDTQNLVFLFNVAYPLTGTICPAFLGVRLDKHLILISGLSPVKTFFLMTGWTRWQLLPQTAEVEQNFHPKNNSKLVKAIGLLTIVMFCLTAQVLLDNYQRGPLWNSSGRDQHASPAMVKQKMISGSKWIVVTSIQYPTEEIRRLSTQGGWNLIVVADVKTPRDWNLTNVHLLSIEKQNLMGSFAKSLPFNNYTRKNLGYLYAIMNGAEWIYDTDDDYKPYGLGLDQFDFTPTIGGMRYVPVSKNISEKLFNPYRFYGFDNMWPRGFPLEYLEEHNNGENRMIACRQMKSAAVQQGLDLDVDAIFRLKYADKQSGLNTHFSTLMPPITLEAGTYSPWNSHNTLFHYRAFFSMFLPTTVTFRVTDIWRSYFAQKLLHIIGEEVAFYPVNAVQFRNAHNYLKDLSHELDVYEKSGKIVEFLDGWKCSKKETPECVNELAENFEEHNFFGKNDTALVKAWTEFLKDVGYEFPKLAQAEGMIKQTNKAFGNCRSANVDLGTRPYRSATNNTYSWEVQALNNIGDLVDWCKKADDNFSVPLTSPKQFRQSYQEKEGLYSKRNTVLVMVNNYAWAKSIGLLQRLYTPFFKTVVFCGNWNPAKFAKEELSILKPINYVNILTEEMHPKGYYYNFCISKVRDLRLQNVTGYFFVADDSLFNIWTKTPLENPVHPAFSYNRVWWDPKALARAYDLALSRSKSDPLIRNAWNDFRFMLNETKPNLTAEMELKTYTGKRVSDFLYITPSVLNMMAGMSEVFTEARVFVETAFAKIFDAVHTEKGGDFLYLWETNRRMAYELYNSSYIGMHPMKMSVPTKDLKNRVKSVAHIRLLTQKVPDSAQPL